MVIIDYIQWYKWSFVRLPLLSFVYVCDLRQNNRIVNAVNDFAWIKLSYMLNEFAEFLLLPFASRNKR